MESIAEQTRWLDAVDQAALVQTKQVSPHELVQAAAERIERLDTSLNAVNLRWFDHTSELARSGALPSGPLRGVPFLLKDLWAHLEGQPLSNGNRALRSANYVSTTSTWLVERFLRAGLAIMGRGASPEWGSLPTTEPLAFGITRNPWDTNHSPGGSSGGSAAAVAAGMVPMAHASDGGGSIRIPASCCGLVGLKTSQGRITVGPARDESGLGVELCVSRSVRDTALLLDVSHGPGVGDAMIAPAPIRPYLEEATTEPGRLRIGLLDFHPRGVAVEPDCVAAVHQAARLLESLGHHVEPAYPAALGDHELPKAFSSMWAVNMAVNCTRAGEMLGRELTSDDVEPLNWALVEWARVLDAESYALALATAAQFRRSVRSWWSVDGWDLLLTPTMARVPPPVGAFANNPDKPLAPFAESGTYVPFTSAFNVSHQPAINVPMHWTAAGLPVGVQLVADCAREDLLLRVAGQIERAAPWAHRRPPLG